jgi:Nidogen-like
MRLFWRATLSTVVLVAGVSIEPRAAVRAAPPLPLAGCASQTLAPNDDGSSPLVALPFTLNFFGVNYSSLFVNNNGNVTFDSPLATYIPFDLSNTDRVIIAPFFADVDTRPVGGGSVTYGATTVEGHAAFCVNWNSVGYFNLQTDRNNTFQLLLVDRPDLGGFDIRFRYDHIQWELGSASNNQPAHAGFSNGSVLNSVELAGSGVLGAFVDGGPRSLSANSIGSQTAGEWRFSVTSGCSKNDPRNVAIPFNCNSDWWQWPDRDKDGLPDNWEEHGVYTNGQLLDLAANGANPDVKDVFIYVDVVDGERWNANIESMLTQAFLVSPLNIHLHILRPPGNLARGDVPAQSTSSIAFFNVVTKAVPAGATAGFSSSPWAATPSTPQLAKYICVCLDHADVPRVNLPTIPGWQIGGDAIGVRGDHLVVTLIEDRWLGEIAEQSGQPVPQPGPWREFLFDRLNAITTMHELGHLFGLDHHGTTGLPDTDPNYKSIMSYAYNAFGVPVQEAGGVTRYVIDFNRGSTVNFDWRVGPDTGSLSFIFGQNGERAGFYGSVSSVAQPQVVLEPELPIGEILQNPIALQNATDAMQQLLVSFAFDALPPARILETRNGLSTVDGAFNGIGARAAGQVTELPVAGRAGVPGDAKAVVLNVTVTNPSSAGYVTVFPCGEAQPEASNINFAAGQTIANSVTSKVGADGKICLFTPVSTDLIVDVNGALPVNAAFEALPPARVLETRNGLSTVDGGFNGIGARAAGQVTELPVAGRAGVPNDAKAVILNVTVTNPSSAGYATVFPCGEAQPEASNINFAAGQTIANSVTSKIGADGKVCVFTLVPSDLIVDVNGALPVNAAFDALPPARVLETRNGLSTVDGAFNGIGARAAGQVTELPVAGRAGVPGDAQAVVLNVTVTNPSSAGYATVFPCGEAQPEASNINFAAGQTIANGVTSKVGADGKICVFTLVPTDLIVDVNGAYST